MERWQFLQCIRDPICQRINPTFTLPPTHYPKSIKIKWVWNWYWMCWYIPTQALVETLYCNPGSHKDRLLRVKHLPGFWQPLPTALTDGICFWYDAGLSKFWSWGSGSKYSNPKIYSLYSFMSIILVLYAVQISFGKISNKSFNVKLMQV